VWWDTPVIPSLGYIVKACLKKKKKSTSIGSFIYLLILAVLGFELKASCLLSSILSPEPLQQPCFVLGISERGSREILAGGWL
jgi:hypothetical protein